MRKRASTRSTHTSGRKPLTKKQKKELFQEFEKKEDENFDPRHHRLKDGIPKLSWKFSGTGTKFKG